MSKEYLTCFQNFTAYSWEYQQNFGGRIVPSKRLASMVGAQINVPFPEIADDDQDAKEVLAFSRSFAGKVEEARDLVTEEEKVKEKQPGLSQKEIAEEAQVREDKKKTFEEDPIPGLVPVVAKDPDQIDESGNQAVPSTPRPMAEKMPASQSGQEPEGKKLEQTVVKPAQSLEADSSASKRLKADETVERRLEMTQVGDDIYYHLDQTVGQEELRAYDYEVHEAEEEDKHEVPKALWSEAPLDRTPPDPPKWVDDLADSVEEWRLKRLGVLESVAELKEDHQVCERLEHQNKYLKGRVTRRSRLVAREYANYKRDDVHSPATGSQALRLLPVVYLMRRHEEESGGPNFVLGFKDAFLQVPQEEPAQVTTAGGHFLVKRNLPGQRNGAKAC